MIITFGVSIVGARGTAGGLTFSANKSGPYARLWSRGANPSSPLQSSQRGNLTTHAAGWRALSAANQALWDAYAALPAQELFNSLGQSYFVSGFNWYVNINIGRIRAGQAIRTTPPSVVRPVAPIIQTVVLRAGVPDSASFIQFSAGDPALADRHLAHCQLVNSVGVNFVPQRMPFIVLAVPDVSRKIFIKPEITSIFGAPVVGQRLLVRCWTQGVHAQKGPTDTFVVNVTA